jgi:hypothetical protein
VQNRKQRVAIFLKKMYLIALDLEKMWEKLEEISEKNSVKIKKNLEKIQEKCKKN